MKNLTLIHVALFLAAAAVAAPVAKSLRIGTVLGYLLAGVLIGPFVLGRLTSFGIDDLYEANEILHFAEFGVVLLLFLIGLELRPTRLWLMRAAIFGAGGAQVLITGLIVGAVVTSFGLAWGPALYIGLALALSSTAFALQIMEENGELTARHGRLGFSILLFQDLAAIPLIALTPLFATAAAVSASASGTPFDTAAAIRALMTIVAVVIVGRLLLDQFFRLVALTRMHEAMTAAGLLTVVLVTLVMSAANLSPSLGAFLAGALLAESAYRHQIEADLKPFEGLLLGLFFTAVGMSLNLGLLVDKPLLIGASVFALLGLKSAVLYAIGRWQGLSAFGARRMALSISQGGEFAFVLLAAGVAAKVVTSAEADLATVIVTLSMAATPALLVLDSRLVGKPAPDPQKAFDTLPGNDGHVIVAGFGRFGQIVARVLRAKGIPFTALDISAEQIESVKKFGSRAYYGDASRLDILEAAQAGKARAFVLAIDDVEASLRAADVVRKHFPDLPIFARARNRAHTHQLMDLGVVAIRRETFASALEMTHLVLRELGFGERDAAEALASFRTQDEKRLVEDYKHYTDIEKLQARARKDAEELERQFSADATERAKRESEKAAS
jgi:glutathione-regulated potassium-efflux system protein KefB